MEGVSLDLLCINTIRMLSIDAVQKANSGHPGLPLDAAPMGDVLWTQFLKHNPAHAQWFNRDRFILSAGHGSMLLYSLLHMTGYPLSLDQIKEFRQWGSETAGHPERHPDIGIEVTTGPLGQGFANGVGVAMAEAYLAAKYNKPDFNLIDHYTYALVSDGDLMEGVASEAASLAGHLKLGKLIYLYDDNHMTLSSSTQLEYTEDKKARFEAYGWHTEEVADGNNIEAIAKAIEKAKAVKDRPSIILVRTIIGYGSPNKENTYEVHGSPLGVEEVKLTKENLDWPVEPPFLIPEEALKQFRECVERGKKWEGEWNKQFEAYRKKYPQEGKEIQELIDGKLPEGWDKEIPTFPADPKGMATRVAAGKVMQSFYRNLPNFVGGSADLNASTFTALKDGGDFESPDRASGDMQGAEGGGWSYAGRNIFYGIREHAMGAISNGMAAAGNLIPFTATFLTFSDYMRPTIRLAALMELQVVFVFTHDSIGLGEDGPTHQSVEHIAALRAIPKLTVIRPGDANESAVAWKVAIESRKRPVVLILSRQNVPTLDRSVFASAEGLRKGAYTLKDVQNLELILIGTGSELGLIVAAAEKLPNARLVSMPSWELFNQQPKEYRDSVLPAHVPTLAVEAGVSQGWCKYADDTISVDTFGMSAPGPLVMKNYGFNVDNVVEKAKALLARMKK